MIWPLSGFCGQGNSEEYSRVYFGGKLRKTVGELSSDIPLNTDSNRMYY